jgi:hypothetical protein
MPRPVLHGVLLAAVAALAAQAAPVHAASDGPASTVPAVRVPAAAWYLVGEDGSVLARHNAAQ